MNKISNELPCGCTAWAYINAVSCLFMVWPQVCSNKKNKSPNNNRKCCGLQSGNWKLAQFGGKVAASVIRCLFCLAPHKSLYILLVPTCFKSTHILSIDWYLWCFFVVEVYITQYFPYYKLTCYCHCLISVDHSRKNGACVVGWTSWSNTIQISDVINLVHAVVKPRWHLQASQQSSSVFLPLLVSYKQ